jgi:nitrogen-specific signal transduction histidine kinase/CheY-like chemotaxis protein
VSARDLSRERELEVELAHLRRLESIGMFTASVIHDLNNLLTPILCLSDLLRAQVAEGGSGLELSDEIRVAATRAASVINPLLAFVRGKPARVERLALRDVVVGLRPLIERLLGKRVELVLSLSEQGSTLADRQRFEHALLNLVANARDAMPNGGVLTIETVDASGSEPPAPPEAPAYVRLRVRDTGVGMSAEVQARVFERFYTTKEVGRGSGIGLAAVRKFVTESGGAIALDSTPGRGTAVTLLLPQVADLEATADPLPSIGETAGGRETILVVDEDEHVRKAVRASLERRRYRVIEADSADHALRLAEICGGRLDLVLVDAALRHFSASAFLQRLRTHVHRVRVLFMSGEAEDTIDMHDTLPTPILRKAFSAEALDRAVHAALSTTLG